MPTTVFPDSSLSFKQDQCRPSFLHAHQMSRPSQLNSAAAQFYSSFTGGNSSSPECSSSDSADSSHENSNSPLRSPDTTVFDDVQRNGIGVTQGPFLRIVEEPVEKFRFRYITEMQGPHGAIMGEKYSGRKKSKSWPSVKLCNYKSGGRDVIVRCTLATTHDNWRDRTTHVHRLICKRDGGEEDDPVDVKLSDSNLVAEFKNITIIYTKKPEQIEELIRKKIRHAARYSTRSGDPPSNRAEFVKEAEKEVKDKMTKQILNQACLRYEALVDNGKGFYEPLCPAIYSRAICNMKSSDFGDLKICKQSAWRGSCKGGDLVFIFVERVQKENIKIRFFEIDDFEEVIWESWADFTPQDVHHQFGIVFSTPQYRSTDIEDNTTKVYFQLYRPSDQAMSEPHEWEYKPHKKIMEVKRKRPNVSMPTFHQPFSPLIPTTVTQPKLNTPLPDAYIAEMLADSLIDNQELPNIDLSDLELLDFDIPMDTEVINSVGSSTPSLTAVLDRLTTPDEEKTREVIMNIISDEQVLRRWATLNNKTTEVEQMISEQIISSSGNQLDGIGVGWMNRFRFEPQMGSIKVEDADQPLPMYADHQMEVCSPSAFTVHRGQPQMDSPSVATATHQMYQPVNRRQTESPREQLARRLDRGAGVRNRNSGGFNPGREAVLIGEPEMEPARTIRPMRPTRRPLNINEDNCIALMEKLVEVLKGLKTRGKLNNNHVRIILKRRFSHVMEDFGDNLFHVMVERYSHPFENMQMFLNLVQEYELHHVLDHKNGSAETPLHIAARGGKVEIVIRLLECGANINVRDGENNTPLQQAVSRGHVDTVQALMAKQPDLSVVDENGNSVLHTAVINENLEMIATLLMKQESATVRYDLLNQRDKKQGHTALHLAVAHRFKDGVKMLLSTANCDVNAVNYSGVTPLGLVMESKYADDREITYLLLRNKADPSLVEVNVTEKPELKADKAEQVDEENEEEECDYGYDEYVRQWDKKNTLFDQTIVAPLCSILDRSNGWKILLPKLKFSQMEIDVIAKNWSPSLMAFHLASSYKPEISLVVIRSELLTMPREYEEAVKIIDDYMLSKIGL